MILIVGGSGYVGTHLARVLAARGESVVATHHHRPRAAIEWPGVVPACLDARDAGQVAKLLDAHCITDVVNLSGATTPDWCEAHPGEARQLNVGIPRVLGEACSRHGTRLIQLSTCHVFDGTRPASAGGYTETDEPGPVNVYGTTKLDGERALATVPRCVVLRLPHVIGPPLAGHPPDILGRQVAAFREGRGVPVLGSADLVSPIHVDDLTALLLAVLATPVDRGTFHCGGHDVVSKEALARLACAAWGFDPSLIVPPKATIPGRALRPANAALGNELARVTFGFSPLPLATAIERLAGAHRCPRFVRETIEGKPSIPW